MVILGLMVALLVEIIPLWKLYYHLVWSTYDRQPLLTPVREAQLYRYIARKVDLLGCVLQAIGGIDDHVHLVVSIPPKLAIADFVKHIKGGSAHDLNHSYPGASSKFGWQNEYGVFLLGSKQLDRAATYVQNQKDHHKNGTTIASLETTTDA
ncbi:MAG: IS200/IS605 family transposase [Leptolyngbya sp. BL-A-14]